MIVHLHVRNFALIDELDLSFVGGFSSITGETGAGKSILLGAMSLALGERADLKSALNQQEKCIVELTVRLEGYGMEEWFAENDLDYAVETILRREILPSGKSRAFVNDTPVNLSILNSISSRLIDIHSQNDTILLRDPSFQLQLMDGFAENHAVKRTYEDAYRSWKEKELELEALMNKATEGQDIDYLRFLVDELTEAKIESENEEEELEAELHRLQHAEEVAESLGEGDAVLSDTNGVLDQLNRFIQSLSQAAKYDQRVEGWVERAQSTRIELQDIANEISRFASNVDSDPGQLQMLDNRMGLIQHLKSKHRVFQLSELISLREDMADKLELYDQLEEKLKQANEEVESAKKIRDRAGAELTKSRLSVLPKVETEISAILTQLNMPDAVIQLQLHTVEPTITGVDAMNWLFSANRGRTPQVISKIASGGELSRVMLTLKAIMSRVKGLPTVIFDEIDTGISGETAKRVAEILREMGLNLQVFAITHLPQIAAASSTHYLVEKQTIEGVTRTQISKLNDEQRIDEVSRILSGKEVSEAARANAKELLMIR